MLARSARSWLQAVRLALARKTRLHDFQMLGLYWALEIWTLILNFTNPSSYLSQLFHGPESSLIGMFCFCFFFIASNALYLYVWLADPGFVIVSLDKELAPTVAGPESLEKLPNGAVETSGLLKRVGNLHSAVVEIDGTTPPAHDANYCYLCDHTIPPRAHHCRHCDRCVAKFDHHCPFLNNCVGARTHRSFIAFCACQSVVMAYAVVSSFSMVALFERSSDMLMNCLYVVTTLACTFLLMMASFLSVGHMALMAKNRTTWEYLIMSRIRHEKWRGVESRYTPPANYDQGVVKNFAENCSSIPRPDYLFATRIVRHNAAWDGTDEVEIDTFDAELDSIQPLTVHGLSGE